MRTPEPSELPIVIKEFNPDFAEHVWRLILNIQQEEFGIPITFDQQPDLKDIPSFYQTNRGNFWIAIVGSRVVGTIALLDIGNEQLALRKMFVHSAFRGSRFRVAHTLLERALEWSRVHGGRQIFLGTTAQFLAAHRFYEKTGFSEISRESLPTSFPVMAVDTKFYTMTVSES